MKTSIAIKRLASYPLFWIQNIKMSCINNNNNVLILMYHHVLGKNDYGRLLQDGMYVKVETFEKQLTYLIRNFNLLTLEECFSVIRGKYSRNNNKPVCCITFDDGWKDIYENVYPILRYYKKKATVFLPTDMIGTNRQLWINKLGIIISKMKNGTKNEISNILDIDKIEKYDGSPKETYEYAIENIKNRNNAEIDLIIKEMAMRWHVDFSSQKRSFLTWDEIKEMHLSGVVQYGSHTKSHIILTMASDETVEEELVVSKEKLLNEGVVSKSFIPFAYPNGNHNETIARMVEATGYSLAVTTMKGWNRVGDIQENFFRLHRVGIHEDMTSTDAMFSCRIYGYY